MPPGPYLHHGSHGPPSPQVEATVFLSKLVRKYTIHLPTGTDTKKLFEGQNVMALSPVNPIRLWFKERT
jgi:hypothetical protein